MNTNDNDVILNYFNSWKNKDSSRLSQLLDENITLTDWENKIQGSKNVMNFNNLFFENVDVIELEILDISIENKIAFAHLRIVIDGEELQVVDKIVLSETNQIINIHAFKC